MGILSSILGALGNNTVGQSALPVNGPMTDMSQGGGLLGGDPSMSAQGGGAMGAGNTSGGLFGAGGLLDFSDPQKLMALQLIANGSRPPGEMLNGLPQIAQYGQRMQQDRQERAAADRDRRDKLEQSNRTAEWVRQNHPEFATYLDAGMPAADVFNLAINPKSSKDDFINGGDGRLYNTKTGEWITAPSAENAGNDETFFGNPIAVTEADGSVSYGQIGNKGSFRPITLGEGQSFAPPTKTVDAGTETILMDQAGNVISRTPKNNREEARQSALGAGEGKAEAETRGEYASLTSKMPGLYSVVDRLDKLSEDATYTLAGQATDWTRSQLGMEPREAAVARAEYTAIVDNQILPLLRDTFGAQFTAEEGQRLAKTLGDPNKSPTEKQALLRAFIQQKERDIQGLSTRIGEGAPNSQGNSSKTAKRLRYNPQTGNLE